MVSFTGIALSPQRRKDIIDALRRGTVPQRGLDLFAVGLQPFESTLDAELDRVGEGGAVFKCIRGPYGSGKTFVARWLQEKARRRGMATAEVQISETETPLHRLETVYRRFMERLATAEVLTGALQSIIDGWFYCLEEDVLADGTMSAADGQALVEATNDLMAKRLGEISRVMPAFAAALRGYRKALAQGDRAIAEGLVAWLAGQPNVAASVKRGAGIKGEIDHFGALSCLQGLLLVLRDSGKPGMLLVLDEVETLQRVRGDVREKGLNALRQFVDEIDAGRFPGLYLLITGTPSFFNGPQGISRLPPLAQRLHVDFSLEGRFDNPRAVQIRLSSFDIAKLIEVGTRVRDIYIAHSQSPDRLRHLVDDAYIADLAKAITGKLGEKVGIAPRIFLKKLVADVLDRVDLHAAFDPRRDYPVLVATSELTAQEQASLSVDDIKIEI